MRSLHSFAGLEETEARCGEASHLDEKVEQGRAALKEGEGRRPRCCQRHHGTNRKFTSVSDESLETVPLPSTVEEVNNANMAECFASGAYSQPAGGLVLEAVPVPLTSPPTAA